MDDVGQILRKNINKFDEEYQKIEQQLSENMDSQKENLNYLKCLSEPIKSQQILFWCKGAQTCEDTPREIFDYLYEHYGDSYEYIWVTKTNKDCPKGLPAVVRFVKKKSSDYWNALAVSKYLVGNGVLPAVFLKRDEQIYINTMMGKEAFWPTEEPSGFDFESAVLTDLMKADYTISSMDKAEDIAENIIRGREDRKQRFDSNEKKKILLWANWNSTQLQRRTAEYVSQLLIQKGYQVTMMARKGETFLNEAFAALSPDIRKVFTRGRMVLRKEESIYLQLIEAHPELYRNEKSVHDYVDELMKREWQRLCGNERFDCIISVGKLSLRGYLQIASFDTDKRVIVDQDTLSNVRDDNPVLWQQMMELFDVIGVVGEEKEKFDYGSENKKKITHLPIVRLGKEIQKDNVNCLTMDGKQYMVVDRWFEKKGGEFFRLAEFQNEVKDFVNKDELDDFILNYLYMFPVASAFYGQYRCYCKKDTAEYDVMEEICRVYGIKVKQI